MEEQEQSARDGAEKPPEYLSLEEAFRERHELVTCANALGLALLLYLFLRASLPTQIIHIFMLILPEIRYFNNHLMAPDWVVQLIESLCFVLSATLPFLFYMTFIRIPRRAALPFRRPRIAYVVSAVLISLGVSVLGSIASGLLARFLRLFGLIPIIPALPVPIHPDYLLAGMINICVLPALLEELIYRGVIMQSLRRFGDAFAVVASAAVFSLMHLNLTQAPTAFLMGLTLGYFVMRTGSLWTGIIIHLVNNMVAMLEQMIETRMTVQGIELMNTTVAIVCLTLGFIALLVLARSAVGLFQFKQQPSAFTSAYKAQIALACPAMIIVVVLAISLSLRNVQMLP